MDGFSRFDHIQIRGDRTWIFTENVARRCIEVLLCRGELLGYVIILRKYCWGELLGQVIILRNMDDVNDLEKAKDVYKQALDVKLEASLIP